MVARSRSTESTVMPERVWPTLMVRAAPLPMTPISETASERAAIVAAQQARRTQSAIKWRNMKPVGIFRHSPTEGPGYFASYLERRSIEWQLIALDQGAAVPRDPRRF